MSQPDPVVSSSQQPQQVSSTVHILSLLLRLRQCCCHLSLLKKVHTLTCSVQSKIHARTHKDTQRPNCILYISNDSYLSLFPSLLRLSIRRSCRVMGSSCLWRSSSMLCHSPPAPHHRALTPKTLWPLMASASPHSCSRTPVRAPRWALTSQLPTECENASWGLFDSCCTKIDHSQDQNNK